MAVPTGNIWCRNAMRRRRNLRTSGYKVPARQTHKRMRDKLERRRNGVPVRSCNGGNAEDNGQGTKPEHCRAKPEPVSRFLISLKPLHRRGVDDFGDSPALQLGFKSHEDNRMPKR
jgi:hypothetical protein